MDNETYIWQYLRSQGLTNAGAAGLMGNLYAESGLIPNNLQNTYEKTLNLTDDEYTKRTDNGTYTNFVYDKAGYGLAQWTYWSRKQNLLNFAKKKGTSIGDISMQLEFLLQELAQTFPKVLSILKTTNTVKEASNTVLLEFEKPAKKDDASVQNQRANYSWRYYNKFVQESSQPVVNNSNSNTQSQMKYSSSNKPIECIMRQSTCYKGTKKMNILGVLWHSTGCNNPNLKRYVQPDDNASNRQTLLNLIGVNTGKSDWNHTSIQSGVNAWVGKLADGTVASVQTLPWDYRPWGCGSGSKGSCNSGFIQFEICEDGLTDKNYFNAIYKEACELTAYLCKLYNINPTGTVKLNGVTVPTILCHQDSCKLGLGSNHADVLHWFPKFGKNMNHVRDDVASLLNSSNSIQIETTQTDYNTQNVCYQVIVNSTKGLNCRSSNSTSSGVIKTYGNNTILNIIKENNGWGYTGEGWVYLQYTKKYSESTPIVQQQILTSNIQHSEEEEEDMTQERFNEMMNTYLQQIALEEPSAWSKEAREWCEQKKIVNGDDKGYKMYKKFMTREELAAVLYRYNNLKN